MGNTKEISQEELWMQIYFEELMEAGIIDEIIYQPAPFILSPKVEVDIIVPMKTKEKIVTKTLIQEHIYTPDFMVMWTNKAPSKLVQFLGILENKIPPFIKHFGGNNYGFSIIEVKASWDSNNMTRIFTARTQPWIYQESGRYINLIKLPDIFKETFIPTKLRENFYYKVNTKKAKIGDPKFTWTYRTLTEYI